MLLDLGGVTRTLLNILQQTVAQSPVWPSAQALSVLPHPPDRLNGDATIGLYLYHLVEDAAFKGQPPPPGDELRFTPMALQLSYVLSAHADLSDSDNGTATLREQLMMGLAVKALRDYPVITDATLVNGQPVLDPAIRGDDNRLRIYLQPVPANEAVSYWTAGSQPLRLSSYYQVSVVMLEPDEPPTLTAQVLRYGLQVFAGGMPHLDYTQSTLSLTLPGESAPRQISLQPAQVAVGDELRLYGSNFDGSAALLVQGAGWPQAVDVGPSWGEVWAEDNGFCRVQANADVHPVLPGIYAAQVRVLRDGVAQTSNSAPFTVVPGMTTVSAVAANGAFSIDGTGFSPTDAVEVYVGETRLQPSAATPPNAGEFNVASPTHIDARLPAGLESGTTLILRIVVNGAQAAPRWLVAP